MSDSDAERPDADEDRETDALEVARGTPRRPPSLAVRARRRAEVVVLRGLLAGLGRLPYRSAMRAGACVGRFAYRVHAPRRRITLSNLERVYGTRRSRTELQQIALASFENLGMLLSDFARMPALTRTGLGGLVEVRGMENLVAAKALNRGVLCLGAHFGSFELMSFALAMLGHPLAFVVRTMDNPRLETVIRQFRETCGNRTFPKQSAIKEMMREIRRKGVVGILIDQRAFPENGVLVDVLGTPAWTSVTAATMALRTQAPVVPVTIERKADRTGHVLRIEPAVPIVQTGDRKRDIEENTRAFNAILERWVAHRPDHWLWCHDRWRE